MPSSRLRMFAGPNGSGKSTLKSVLPAALLGVYLNPDEVELTVRKQGFLDLSAFNVVPTALETLQFFSRSQFLAKEGRVGVEQHLRLVNNRLFVPAMLMDSYLASVIVDFLRQQLLARRESLTFETVMSHPSKVNTLAQAQLVGYRTYLYYIATDDPEINVSRVRNRVRQGGHSVPDDKVVSRYFRSLDLLMEAIRHTHRAYVFDNSGDRQERTWLAEITGGRELELKTDRIPAWFKRAVLDKFVPLN